MCLRNIPFLVWRSTRMLEYSARQAYSLFVSIDMLTTVPASDPWTRWEDVRLLSVVTMVPATTDDHSARLLVSTKTYFQRTREFLIYSPTRQDLVFETAFEHWSSCHWPYQLTTNLLNLFNSYFAQHHSVKSGLAMIPVRATPRGLRAKVFPRLVTDNFRNDRTSCSINIAIVFNRQLLSEGMILIDQCYCSTRSLWRSRCHVFPILQSCMSTLLIEQAGPGWTHDFWF